MLLWLLAQGVSGVCRGPDDGLLRVLDRAGRAPLPRRGSRTASSIIAGGRIGPRGAPIPARSLRTTHDLEELRAALVGRAPQDDVWNSRTVAAWLSARAGRRVSAQTALHYLRLLDFTPQAPRPRHNQAGQPPGARRLEKKLKTKVAAVHQAHPRAAVDVSGKR